MQLKLLRWVSWLGCFLVVSACASNISHTPALTAPPSPTSVPSTLLPTLETSTPIPLSPTPAPDLVISLVNAKRLKLLRQLGPSPITVSGISDAQLSPDGK